MKGENSHLRREVAYFAPRYKYIINNFIAPYAKEKGLQFDPRTCDTIDFVMTPMLQNAREAGMFEDRVQTLQHELILRENKSGVVSDDQLAQDFRKLASQIKTLSRQIRPRDDVDVLEALGPSFLVGETKHQMLENRASRKLFIEAWMWSSLVNLIFLNPFIIVSTDSKTIFNSWIAIFGTGKFYEWPNPSTLSETWRYTTVKHLVDVESGEDMAQKSVMDQNEYLTQHSLAVQTDKTGFIEDILARITTDIESLKVDHVASSAVTLAMHMWLQKCRLQITFPNIGDQFDRTEMKSLRNVDDEDEIEDGVVMGVINPGLTKWGDVHGKNFDQRYDIVPSLVQL
ncbi:hypothetical protein GQ44DRAFT_619774 [Phaeosphaeriaceae sp. PMI808]|nr:hypothetical protein GQ44DRAFT_619774 [Phaeosphaeriaceae sp. PMI808]